MSPRLVIAGTQSGVGKTSVALGLARALARRGLRVQTFKVGPDFLDPTYLRLASGRPCYNLDGWMMGRDYVLELFARHAQKADFSLVEGVMGLYDGAGPAESAGSTAEIARWLQAPVLLVVDARGLGRSLAAMVQGYSRFDPGLHLAGVVANRIGSQAHRDLLAECLTAAALPPLTGGILRAALPVLPSRHLGLVTADREGLTPALLDRLADALEGHVCLESLVRLARAAPALPGAPASRTPPSGTRKRVPARGGNRGAPPSGTRKRVPARGGNRPAAPSAVRIGLAQDRAFHFYYQDLLDALEASGAELVPFSPVEDRALPPGLDGLYLGGGYPEVAVEALSANRGMLDSIRAFARGPMYAECGGLMYLAQGVETLEGRRYPLVGLLPGWTRMLERRKALGYVEVTLEEDSLWAARGDRLRGHEFHYSEWSGPQSGWRTPYSLRRERSGTVEPEGFSQGRTLASYVHVHYPSRPGAVERFVTQCRGAS